MHNNIPVELEIKKITVEEDTKASRRIIEKYFLRNESRGLGEIKLENIEEGKLFPTKEALIKSL